MESRCFTAHRDHFRPSTVWITGLSGSGKSTLAAGLAQEMRKLGYEACCLDGDVLRAGLNSDLSFSRHDRSENIRRTAEVAKIVNDSGITTICSLISPFAADRANARAIIGESSFIEVYLDVSLSECEARDSKGLYQRARAGEIAEFTGISSPYEAPTAPDLRLDTSNLSVERCVSILLDRVLKNSETSRENPSVLNSPEPSRPNK